MTDLPDDIGTWSVLKWIVLVLVAGFIGQFGRMAANAIAAVIRARRQKQESMPGTPVKPSAPESSFSSTSSSRPVPQPDKKMLNAIAKTIKKEAKKKIKSSG